MMQLIAMDVVACFIILGLVLHKRQVTQAQHMEKGRVMQREMGQMARLGLA